MSELTKKKSEKIHEVIMKKLIPLIFIMGFIFACEKTVVEYSDEPMVTVANPIEDVSVEEGTIQTTIDMSNVFSLRGPEPGTILISLSSIQRPELVTGSIADNILTLHTQIGATGASEVVIRGEWGGYVAYETFIFTVNSIQANAALNSAISYFQQEDYARSATYFNIVISKTNEDLKSEAYMGLGWAQMRNNQAFEAYQSFQTCLTIDPENLDTQAGLSLLEYATKQNYQAAISYGQSVLSTEPDYIFSYDTQLDKTDLLINIALSQYMLQLWEACIDTIRKVDPAFSVDSTQDQFKTKILQKLEELLVIYSK